jgi:2-dehydropantoate 2-reductase
MTDDSPLKTLIFGAGAIGTYIGASLLLHGNHVVFIEKPALAKKLNRSGLQLRIGDEEHIIQNPRVVNDAKTALSESSFDVIVFALKSFDTISALNPLAELTIDIPPLLCLSNGVENEETIRKILGDKKVIAGTVTSAIGRISPGKIILERLRGIGIADGHLLSARIGHTFNQAGLNAYLYPVGLDMKWSKMLTNLLANATSAILDMTPAEIFNDPKLYAVEISQIREALTVMAIAGIKVTDLPATPVKALAFVIKHFPLWLSRPLLAKAIGSGRGAKMPSFHIDLHHGRGNSEVDYLNGAVVRKGKALNVPTPVNDVLNSTLIKLSTGELPIDSFSRQPEKLFDLIEIHKQRQV